MVFEESISQHFLGGDRLPEVLQFNIAVHLKTRTRRDQVAHNHIFLESTKEILLPKGGRFGEDPGGILKGRCRNEAFRLQRGLGDTQQHRGRLSRAAAFLLGLLVDVLEVQLLNLFTPQEGRITRYP